MTFARKFRKLRRDPKSFFADSKDPVTRKIGLLLYGKNVNQTDSVQHNLQKKAIQNNKDVKITSKVQVAKNAGKNVFDSFRSMDMHFRTDVGRVDVWRCYREKNETDFFEKKNDVTVVVYPLGVFSVDVARSSLYQKDGCATFFLPVWEFVDGLSDIDDLEFRANKEPFLANYIAKQLLAFAAKRNATAVVLPYDATALTRAIAIQCRWLGLVTICHLPSYQPVLDLYNTSNIATLPISEWLVVDEKFVDSVSFPVQVMRRCAVLNDEANISIHYSDENDKDRLRLLVGSGATEDIRILMLPPLQLKMSNKEVEHIALLQVQELLLRAEPTDHFVIVAKRRKRGFMNEEVVKVLSKKYRKTVIFYDETNIMQLSLIAKEVVVPDGILADLFCGLDVSTYPVKSPQQINCMTGEKDVVAQEHGLLDCQDIIVNPCFPYPGIKKLVSYSKDRGFIGEPFGVFDDTFGRVVDGDGPGLDVIAVPDPITNIPITQGRQKYLLELLHANRRVYGAGPQNEVNAAEVFVQWGEEPIESKERPEVFRSYLGRPRLFLEDGFIRSQGLWTDPNEPTLSVVMDTRAIYYNSLRPSLLETILNSNFELDESQLLRARSVMSSIVNNKISKYNHAPVIDLDFRANGKKTILIVDQKVGDMSIKYGSANDDTFFAMFRAAIELGDNVEIIIKQHPCAISGSPGEAHFTADSLAEFIGFNNLHLIGFDVNPYSLINAVDEVWVVSSGMGFEALMAGKPVRCFGVPFYSNWGITQDEINIDRRRRQRSLEEIFYIFYVMLSRYVDPVTGKSCEIERLIDYFSGIAKD